MVRVRSFSPMVLQVQDRVDELYQRIKTKALSKDSAGIGTIMILVHPDLDAICAVRILVVPFA
jgi:hypothetical protein